MNQPEERKSHQQVYKPGSISMNIESIENTRSGFFDEKWFAWVMFFVIPIVGVYLFWKNRFYHVGIRIFLTILFLIYVAIGTMITYALNSPS